MKYLVICTKHCFRYNYIVLGMVNSIEELTDNFEGIDRKLIETISVKKLNVNNII